MIAYRRVALLCSVTLGSLSPARAAPNDQATAPEVHLVIPIATAEPALEDQAAELSVSLVVAVEDQGHSAQMAGVTLDDAKSMLGCRDDVTCQRELASTMSASGVISGRLASHGDGVTLTLTWVTADEVYRDSFELDATHDASTFAPQAEAFAARRRADSNESSDIDPTDEDVVGSSVLAPTNAARIGRRRVSFAHVKRSSWAITAGGAATIAVGALFLRAGRSRQSAVDNAPTNTVADFESLEAHESAAKRYNVVGTLFVLAGSAALTTGAIFIAGDARSQERPMTVIVTMPSGPGSGVVLGIGGRL